MSYSSLYGIKKDFTGEQISEYNNSWWFTPIVWDVLPEKYIPSIIENPYGYKKTIIADFDGSIWRETNHSVNRCNSNSDRICWELTNQQIFFVKDKNYVANSIRKFLVDNKPYCKSRKDDVSFLEKEHIIERFNQIANDIENLNEVEYEYFVFKNSSCDDNVEYWFNHYNENNDEYEERPLSEVDKIVTEFVVIEDGFVKGFINNIDFFNVV